MEEHFHSKRGVCSKAYTEHDSTQSRKKKRGGGGSMLGNERNGEVL